MASLYKRSKSPFWWLKFRQGGTLLRQSTKLRIDSSSQTREAQRLLHTQTLKELDAGRNTPGAKWERWIPSYLQAIHANSPKTLSRYLGEWENLCAFLLTGSISVPCQLTREHCFEYLAWRQQGDAEKGYRPVCRNTAIHELKLLHALIDEAIRRGYCSQNVASRLGLKKDPLTEKPEIAAEHFAIIGKGLEQGPEWMRLCFGIGLATGLRLNETPIPLGKVDCENCICTVQAKGGQTFTAMFDPALAPLFRRLQAERGLDKPAFDLPKSASAAWSRFFDRVGLPQYCFHCTRVSFISRCARNGVPEYVAMKLTNHASTSVHRIYLRVKPEDARQYFEAIRLPFVLTLCGTQRQQFGNTNFSVVGR